MVQVEVYADIACPWCRLGRNRFDRAVAAAGGGQDIELVHRPYQLDAGASEKPRPLMEAMDEMFGGDQAGKIAAEITRLGANEGVEYRFDRARTVNTFTAHRLLWFALHVYGARAQAALATACYDAYFRDGGNIADHTQLAVLAEQVDLDRAQVQDFLASDDGAAEVRDQGAEAKQDGITVVPTFVFDGGEFLSDASDTEAILGALRRARASGPPNLDGTDAK